MSFVRTIFRFILLLTLVFSLYHYRNEVNIRVRESVHYYLPCALPITYSIGGFDSQFGISREEFLTNMAKAEKVWESAAGRELFHYQETGGVLNLNLIYDSRQETTQKLQKIDTAITEKQAEYNALVEEYEIAQTQYESEKRSYEGETNRLRKMRDDYENQVDSWNARGGAPSEEFSRLEKQQRDINRMIRTLESQRILLNKKVEESNALGLRVNTLIAEMKLDVETFNSTKGAHGEEFSEGEYVRDQTGTRINIYEFGSDVKLVRVLTHELGHALGLQHVEDAEAIMYRLNAGKSEIPTPADIAELVKVCRIK